jgi:hypothetical protein
MTYTIANSSFNISSNLCTEDYSLDEALQIITAVKSIDHIIIVAEAHLKDSFYQNLDGLTLLKHLLVDSKKHFYKIPITLLHITPYEYILNNEPDNLIIMAPNISRHRWNAKWKKNLPTFEKNDCSKISFQHFKRYVLYSHKDEQYSEHDARNELGAKKLLQEWNNEFTYSDLPLHNKKQIFLEQTKMRLFSLNNKHRYLQQKQGVNRVLILEDEKKKWEPVFQQLLPNKFDMYSDYTEATNYLKEVKAKIKTLFDHYTGDFYAKGYNNEAPPNESNSYMTDIAAIWKYDMVICDLNFKTHNGIHEGLELIKILRSFDPYIPIMVFTASKKSEGFQNLKMLNANISEVFVKGVHSLPRLTNFILDNTLDYKLYHLQWRTKLNLHRFWNQEGIYFFDYKNFKFEQINDSKKLSIKIVLETLHDLLKPNSFQRPSFHNLIASEIFDSKNESRLLQDIFCLFLISEIKLAYSENMNYEELIDFEGHTSIFKTEKYFRGLRNKLYHVNNETLEASNGLGNFLNFYLLQFLDWLINPLQVEEVRKMLEHKKVIDGKT